MAQYSDLHSRNVRILYRVYIQGRKRCAEIMDNGDVTRQEWPSPAPYSNAVVI